MKETGDSSLKCKLRAALRNVSVKNSTATLDKVSAWLDQHQEVRTIASFSPLPDEVNLLPLLLRHPNRRWVFPRVSGNHLTFHPVINPAVELAPGAFQILEPIAAIPAIPPAEIDAWFCPGLAFDQNGGRLGRGRGFYDRMLANARPGSWKIGITIPERVVESVHAEPHDIRMDVVISG